MKATREMADCYTSLSTNQNAPGGRDQELTPDWPAAGSPTFAYIPARHGPTSLHSLKKMGELAVESLEANLQLTWLRTGEEPILHQTPGKPQKLFSSRLLSKNLKVLYGCETWILTLREDQRLKTFENKVLRKIFGAKRDEVTGEWRKLHNTELHALYSSPDIIRNIKSRRLRWAGHVAYYLTLTLRLGNKLKKPKQLEPHHTKPRLEALQLVNMDINGGLQTQPQLQNSGAADGLNGWLRRCWRPLKVALFVAIPGTK
ncbi:hypothetical protein ANN_06383 [Periplaneta americana]|uniref:Uncharacterized protein n=1 Tax=Periplaneta americana TaxID=6978 RepID=A0ABQ8TFQ8_PERAM|nr:hypothetical protein ANN_06383 [Periplaneta americana]